MVPMSDAERKKREEQVEKSKAAVKRLNDFSYLKDRREKNRQKNEKLRRENEPEQEEKIARPGSPEQQL
jgi:hypothetical protein